LIVFKIIEAEAWVAERWGGWKEEKPAWVVVEMVPDRFRRAGAARWEA
jgi:hypothetical protein